MICLFAQLKTLFSFPAVKPSTDTVIVRDTEIKCNGSEFGVSTV